MSSPFWGQSAAKCYVASCVYVNMALLKSAASNSMNWGTFGQKIFTDYNGPPSWFLFALFSYPGHPDVWCAPLAEASKTGPHVLVNSIGVLPPIDCALPLTFLPCSFLTSLGDPKLSLCSLFLKHVLLHTKILGPDNVGSCCWRRNTEPKVPKSTPLFHDLGVPALEGKRKRSTYSHPSLNPHHLWRYQQLGRLRVMLALMSSPNRRYPRAPMVMYRVVMMDIPKDRMAGKRLASFILFSRGRTYQNITVKGERRRKKQIWT